MAIARLLGEDKICNIGLVYLWNTAELTFLWNGARDAVKFIDPPLSRAALAKAKSVTPVEVIAFLESLPAVAGKSQDERALLCPSRPSIT
ncbi:MULTISPECIES: hypothetical protein [unclassified Mameliella]|uniref:hypothetical protein n=1 Tax=unclassified Mameliella TaxID=2630630 RepID=UPI00273D5FD7|nr:MULTISPECIES: hypothetical protein [unclassified Mameliella]